MTYEFALIEKKEHLWIITLNRPERMNAYIRQRIKS